MTQSKYHQAFNQSKNYNYLVKEQFRLLLDMKGIIAQILNAYFIKTAT
jgi:hypothetical protein